MKSDEIFRLILVRPMILCRLVPSLITAILLCGCGTLEDNAWTTGIAREDAYDIRDVVRAANPDCQIYGYSRDPSHADRIYCYTSCKTYPLQRTRNGWKIVPGVEVITVV
jgi:hypothetical protein